MTKRQPGRPTAQIAFIDLSRDNSDSVWTPGDLSNNYFDFSFRHDARIHSDSWGSDSTAYDFLAYSVDMYTWRNQDFVSVFAAGNFGAYQQAKTTVTSPATAKNTISVGATLGLIPNYQASTDVEVRCCAAAVEAACAVLACCAAAACAVLPLSLGHKPQPAGISCCCPGDCHAWQFHGCCYGAPLAPSPTPVKGQTTPRFSHPDFLHTDTHLHHCPCVQVYDMTVSISAGGQTLETRVYRIVQAAFGGSFKSLVGNTYSLLPAAPEEACSALGNSLLQGNIVLIKRSGNCFFLDKARAAQAAGGAGAIITNNMQEGYFAMKASGSVSIPVGGVPLSVGR